MADKVQLKAASRRDAENKVLEKDRAKAGKDVHTNPKKAGVIA